MAIEKLKLYKDNRIDKEYEISITELISGFIKAREKQPYLQAAGFERAIILYIGVDLESAQENVPLTDQEYQALWDEYESQTKNK